MKKIIVLALACITSFAAAQKQQAIVSRVVDGDTIEVFFENQFQKVRLLGIDTPEVRRIPRAYRMAEELDKDIESLTIMGKAASAFVKDKLRKGDMVLLEFDVQRIDKYGRLLAFVFLTTGENLNILLASQGLALQFTLPPNVQYAEEISNAVKLAREMNRGLWNPDFK